MISCGMEENKNNLMTIVFFRLATRRILLIFLITMKKKSKRIWRGKARLILDKFKSKC